MTDTTTTETPVWTEGFSEDQVGFVQTKNWDGPAAVLESYQQLEKLVGKDPGRVLTIPNPDATPEEWSEVYTKLGRPNDPSGYKLPEIEGASEEQDALIRQSAFDLDLTPAQTAKMREQVYANSTKAATERQDSQTAAMTETAATLRNEWGADYDANNEFAADGVMFVGGEEFLKSVQDKGLLGDPAFVKAMAKIGEMQAEPDGLIGGQQAGAFEMSPGQAKANITALTMDKGYQEALFDKRHPGHKAAVEKQTRLYGAAYTG